ncbi:unnamed protein product [Closterium sp. NIES-53]
MPFFTGLDIVAYPPVATPGAAFGKTLQVTAPAGSPIVITFPAPVTDPKFPPQCAVFSAAGGPKYLTTTANAATKTITCKSSTLAEFTLASGPSVPLLPTPPPTPAPMPAPTPAPEPAPTPAPTPAPEPAPTAPPSVPPPSPERPLPPPPAPTAPPASPNTTVPGNSSSSANAASGASTASTPTSSGSSSSSSSSSGTSAAVYIAVVVGALIFIALIVLLVWWWRRSKKQKQLEAMALAAEKAASLETALIGASRTPAAGSLRTKAKLENETF